MQREKKHASFYAQSPSVRQGVDVKSSGVSMGAEIQALYNEILEREISAGISPDKARESAENWSRSASENVQVILAEHQAAA